MSNDAWAVTSFVDFPKMPTIFIPTETVLCAFGELKIQVYH